MGGLCFIANIRFSTSQNKRKDSMLEKLGKAPMDGDQSAKTMDAGANSAIRNVEGADAIHESSHQSVRYPGMACVEVLWWRARCWGVLEGLLTLVDSIGTGWRENSRDWHTSV